MERGAACYASKNNCESLCGYGNDGHTAVFNGYEMILKRDWSGNGHESEGAIVRTYAGECL